MNDLRETTAELLKVFDGKGCLESATASLARWRHNVTNVPDITIADHTLAMVRKCSPGFKQFRHRGGRTEPGPGAPGTAGLLPAGSYGSWSFEGGPQQILHVYLSSVQIATASEYAFSPKLPEIHDRLNLDDHLLQTMGEAIDSALDEPTIDRLYIDTLTTAITVHVLKYYSNASRFDEPRGGLSSRQLKRVCEFTLVNLEQDIALAELAAIAGLSPHHFCRAFKVSTGLPPHAWLMASRIERAEELMVAQPGLALSEVALACGFADQSHFTRTFTRVRGASPGRWRRERLT